MGVIHDAEGVLHIVFGNQVIIPISDWLDMFIMNGEKAFILWSSEHQSHFLLEYTKVDT
jgi:hypothetical protein